MHFIKLSLKKICIKVPKTRRQRASAAMAPKESFTAKQQRLKQLQESNEDEATAERIEREMADEINAQAQQNAFKIPAWVNIAGALLGVLQLSYRIEQERERRADDYFANPRPEIHSLVASMSFEVGVACLIAINCVLLGWQASLPDGENTVLFDIGEHVFVSLFLIEWCMRVLAFGWVWVFEFSNAADTIMVPWSILHSLGWFAFSSNPKPCPFSLPLIAWIWRFLVSEQLKCIKMY